MSVLFRHKYQIIATVAITLMAVIALYYGTKERTDTPMATVADSVPAEERASGLELQQQEEKEQRLKTFNEWVEDMVLVPSIAEASQMLAFKLQAPRSAIVGKLHGIYLTDRKLPEKRRAFMIFGQPGERIISIEATVRIKQPAYASWVKKARAESSGLMDTELILVSVNGKKGTGLAPGLNTGPFVNTNRFRPGVVSWWDDGVEYTLVGPPGPDGTPLDVLLEIARSMQ